MGLHAQVEPAAGLQVTCIRCKKTAATATPSLCLRCFFRVAWEWYEFHHPIDALHGSRDNPKFKNYCNRLQRDIRRSHKQHDDQL